MAEKGGSRLLDLPYIRHEGSATFIRQ